MKLAFHGKECCIFAERTEDGFDEETKSRFLARLKYVKGYDGESSSPYGDHIWWNLWQCTRCGALFLLENVEQTDWDQGDDVILSDYYQVESIEQADRLVEGGALFARYQAPKVCV